jgi:superfamily II DNA or RNA helicase
MSRFLHLVVDNTALMVVQPPPWLESALVITEKKVEMVYDKGAKRELKKLTRRKRPLYSVLREASPRVIQTYQGLWKRVSILAAEHGMEAKIKDNRLPMPPHAAWPQLHKTHGFRFSQKDLLCKFLLQNRSGLLGAPTRYGKSTLLVNTVRAYPGVTTVVTVPGEDLVKQLYKAVKEGNPRREVLLMGAGSSRKVMSDDVTVCSMDSLHKIDAGRVELLLVDEPHACVTDSRLADMVRFDKARILGFGATLKGRFDGRDALIEGLIGPVLAERTYLEAVAEGAICPLVVLFLRCEVNANQWFFSRDQAYNSLLFHSNPMAVATARICRDIVPDGWQTLVFIKNEKQALLYLEKVGSEGTIAMAKRMTKKEREALMARMQSGEVKRCLASEIYAQGVTFSDVRVLVNASAGGNNTSAIQKPGRLAEIRPGKPCGIVVDFLFAPVGMSEEQLEASRSADCPAKYLASDSQARMKAYSEKGYVVKVVGSLQELKTEFGRFASGEAEELGICMKT